MYCSASATLWMTSAWRMTVIDYPSRSLKTLRQAVLVRVAVWPRRRRHDPVDGGDRERGEQKRDVDHGLVQQRLLGEGLGIDERLEKVNRRDADDRRRELHLEHGRVDVRQPLRLVGMVLEAHARHEGLVAPDDHHDQQVADHHDVDEA